MQVKTLEEVSIALMQKAKEFGYSDPQLAYLYCGVISTETILKVRNYRKSLGVEPVYKLVDTCAAEFEAITPYYYSTYEQPIENIDGEFCLSMMKFESPTRKKWLFSVAAQIELDKGSSLITAVAKLHLRQKKWVLNLSW